MNKFLMLAILILILIPVEILSIAYALQWFFQVSGVDLSLLTFLIFMAQLLITAHIFSFGISD